MIFSGNLLLVYQTLCMLSNRGDSLGPAGKRLPGVCVYSSQKVHWAFQGEKPQSIQLVLISGAQHWFLLLKSWKFNNSSYMYLDKSRVILLGPDIASTSPPMVTLYMFLSIWISTDINIYQPKCFE